MKEPNVNPFLAAILHHLQDEFVEINFGFIKTTIKQSDMDIGLKNVIIAQVKSAYGDCLILEKEGTRIYVNAWQIQTVVPVKDGLFVKDIYQDEHVK